jgi:recombination protein RecA
VAKKSPSTPSTTPGAVDRDAARADAIKYLLKKTPSAFRPEDEPLQLEGISTGSIAVDYIIGNNGLPRSKVSEIFGLPSSGKSTLAATACAKAQRIGLYPVYLDVERGLDKVYATRIGFDVEAAMKGEKGLYVTPESFEDMLIIVAQLAKDGLADLIFVDSVPSLVTRASLEGDITSLGAIGESARMFSSSLPKLTKMIDRPGHKTALVFVNQMRAKISTGWQPMGAQTGPKAMGGYALEHYSSLRIELRQIKKDAKTVEQPSLTKHDEVDKIPVASLHTALAFKNKVNVPYQRINFYIRYNAGTNEWGIDNLQTIIDIALTKNLIETKGGGNYLYNAGSEQMQVRGESALYEWFRARPDVINDVRAKLGV